MTPYATGKRWRLYHGDCLAILPDLDTGSVDGLVTDPPYSSGGQFRGDRMADASTKYLSTGSKQADYLPQFGGDNRDQRGYLHWSAIWLGECLRIVKPGRAAVVFTDWRQLPTTTDAIQAGGWLWRGICPWIKPNPRPQLGRFAASAEYVVWATCGPSEDDAALGCLRGYCLADSPRGDDREHVTQKPLEAMDWTLGIVPAEGVVLDPFCGSGSTGDAAIRSGRGFTGIERSEQYLEISARRLGQAEVDGVPLQLFAAPP